MTDTFCFPKTVCDEQYVYLTNYYYRIISSKWYYISKNIYICG